MFRATAAALSKASRIPLTSKGGNKEYSKGTGSFPGLGPKRIGRHGGGKAPYVLMKERMRTFVVPSGLNATTLLPYVAKSAAKDRDYWVDDLPRALDASEDSKRRGHYGPNGFDGAYYLQLAEQNAAKKVEGN